MLIFNQNPNKMKKEVLRNDMKDCFKIVPTNTEENEFVIVIGNHLATEERFQSRAQAERKLNITTPLSAVFETLCVFFIAWIS